MRNKIGYLDDEGITGGQKTESIIFEVRSSVSPGFGTQKLIRLSSRLTNRVEVLYRV